jgi:hypothetical protein
LCFLEETIDILWCVVCNVAMCLFTWEKGSEWPCDVYILSNVLMFINVLFDVYKCIFCIWCL